jgi:hypothetical protein
LSTSRFPRHCRSLDVPARELVYFGWRPEQAAMANKVHRAIEHIAQTDMASNKNTLEGGFLNDAREGDDRALDARPPICKIRATG